MYSGTMHSDTGGPGMRMRIGELAQRAGVSKETIHFYLREGLLPSPEKVNVRVAYFDQGHFTRLRLIKALQRAHIPLAKVREQLEGLSQFIAPQNQADHERALAVVTEFLSVDGEEPELTLAEVADRAGLTVDQIGILETLGVLEPQLVDSRPVYTEAEAEAAAAVRTILDQGVRLEDLRFVRRYAEVVEQEHGFILHHLINPAIAAGRREQVSATLAFRGLRIIETYLRRQFRRRHLPFSTTEPPWPDLLAGGASHEQAVAPGESPDAAAPT